MLLLQMMEILGLGLLVVMLILLLPIIKPVLLALMGMPMPG